MEEAIEKYYNYKILNNKNYTYQEANIYIKKMIKKEEKILNFNKDICNIGNDTNGIPKLIHFTCKDKNHLNNPVWENCLKKYKLMYPDYQILIYDNKDIYNIVQIFDKKNLPLIMSIKTGAVLADVFRYLILYLRGGYYSDLDCDPLKHIENLSNIQYHGNPENIFYIYPGYKQLITKDWDFYENPCNNCVFLKKNQDNINVFKCLGHKYITEKTNIILGYEYDKIWHSQLLNNVSKKSQWTDNNIGVCQWFMSAKKREKLFLYAYTRCKRNLPELLYLTNTDSNYHYKIINGSGPLFFTKIINEWLVKYPSLHEKICILPCDYFCCGSHDVVPQTKNTFIKHHFTGSWLK